MAKITEKSYLFSWVRKGVSNQISEVDKLIDGEQGSVVERPSIRLAVQLDATPVSGEEQRRIDQMKEFSIVGPGDVVSVNSNAVMNFYPPSGHANFPASYKPYVEFWEPDFAWRYTPAKATGEKDEEDGKLSPWLAVVTCESSRCHIEKKSNGATFVTFDVDDDDNNNEVDNNDDFCGYRTVFPDTKELWKSAHAQGSSKSSAEFCRVIGVNRYKLKANKEYSAFVIPVFETTRLRALGCNEDVKQTLAQKVAWENSFKAQTERIYPFTFPVYFNWTFKTGDETFEDLVRALKPTNVVEENLDSKIDIDVSDLGDGLSYNVLKSKPERNIIGMPAATKLTSWVQEEPFPSPDRKDESDLRTSLLDKLASNPVFQENAALIGDDELAQNANLDDPAVVPPIYGGKHSMATSLENSKEWVKEINLDLHNRAAAGLGKKIIQEYQEQFVNRAWKQVEVVKALNGEIHQRLLGSKVNESIKNKNYKGVFRQQHLGKGGEDNEKFIQNLMLSFNSMKKTKSGNGQGKEDFVTIDEILENHDFPSTFTTPMFQSKTQQLSAKIGEMDLSSLIENVSKNDFYKIPKPKEFSYFSLDSLDFFAYQVLLHSRLYFSKLLKHQGNKRRSLELKVRKNGMKSWPIFKYLSIHKRAPQYINWEKLDYKQLDVLSNKVYKFRKKLNAFATYDQFRKILRYQFPPERVLVKSRYDFLTQYRLLTPRVRGTGSLNKMPSYGSLCKEDKVEVCIIGEILAINENDYNLIFGENSIITKFEKTATLGDVYYFVNREKLMAEMEKDESLKDYVVLGSVVNDEFRMFDDVKESCDLERPDIINIRERAFEENVFGDKIHTIENVYQWVEAYIGSELEKIDAGSSENDIDYAIKTFKAYEDYRTLLFKHRDDLEHTKDTKDYELKNFEAQISEKTKVAEDRINKVVSDYFSVFLSDNDDIREQFIEDCMNSKFPIMAYPQFPEPTYYYLKLLSDKFILPCVDQLKDNSVTMFMSNEAFVEAFLCGMNTEMGRELLWREYPTDQRGSYFKKFWDTETSVENILNGSFFDVKSVHTWNDKLGSNHSPEKSQLLMFAIKGKLMKNFPDTLIYLHKADVVNGQFVPAKSSNDENLPLILKPVAQAFFKDDIYVVGFKISYKTALGHPAYKNKTDDKNRGYMLVFEQVMENLNFQYNVSSHENAEYNGIPIYKACRNSLEYLSNFEEGDCKDESIRNDKDKYNRFTEQFEAIVKPYKSAKHVLTYSL
ncbi:hypothetical protein [Fibrobacter sp. UWB12]|uniref:hypothetical protein n=1 Tax=Fibrobacter sp. UWB12 TaxID=1896203 RepID=UPI0009176A4F|nr:hypothetical protein [Fibrobacter sp. UWB12]SHK60979.1 hypothetical protein SAMN05720759_104172 [Fibrobacter sp. UWB12]